MLKVLCRLRAREGCEEALLRAADKLAEATRSEPRNRAYELWRAVNDQRILVFGLGPHESVDEVEIRWPSGQVSRHSRLTSDREFVFVEGREPFTLPR